MEAKYSIDITNYLIGIGIAAEYALWLNIVFGLATIFLVAWISDFVSRKLIIKIIHKLASRTATTWDDNLIEKRFFHRIAHIVPAIVIYFSIGLVLAHYPKLTAVIRSGIDIYIIVMVVMAIDAFINASHMEYQSLEIAKSRPIKGYIQVAKIFVYFVATILVLSILLHKDPSRLLTGLGAMAAVLLLVFKDTILGFVASIQLSANDMVRVGDWITMPARGTDGNVVEITLNTVKVQNFDKTISTIPTYSLVSESFTNWRGMENSGGRRIKRYISIDMKSVKFCDNNLLERLKRISIISDFIGKIQLEIEENNKNQKTGNTPKINFSTLTNLGVFRKYVEEYLRQIKIIRKDMTLLVTQLQPTENGIPIQIIVFSKDLQSTNYENLQSEIFEHILAVLHEFELKVFQNPTGSDFTDALKK
jgi:miniconductance mechanosensitive channel